MARSKCYPCPANYETCVSPYMALKCIKGYFLSDTFGHLNTTHYSITNDDTKGSQSISNSNDLLILE